jgi:hypothetical protein
MPNTKSHLRSLGALLFLVVLTWSAFFVILCGREFIFDDIYFISYNSDLFGIKTLFDCFHFVLQPSKPVTNFFLAFGSYVGKGSVTGHRIVSITLHMVNVLLVYLNLSLLMRRMRSELPTYFGVLVSALYCVLPIHSESVAIAQFRGDLLAVFFTLSALYFIQRLRGEELTRGRTVLLLLTIAGFQGLAILSKEVYFVLTPVLFAAFYFVGEKPQARELDSRRMLLIGLILSQVVWGVVLKRQIAKDVGSTYSYDATIGSKALPPRLHIPVASRAWMESVLKITTGRQLTFRGLVSRGGIGADWPLSVHIAVLVGFAALGIFFFSLGEWWRVGALIYFPALALYTGIPNLNIGNEHYNYLASLGLVIIVARSFAWLFSFVRHPDIVWQLAMGGYAILLVLGLLNRSFDLQTRRAMVYAELAVHPESGAAWNDVAQNLYYREAPEAEVRAALAEAQRLAPTYAPNELLELSMAIRYQRWPKARESMRVVMESSMPGRRKAQAIIEYIQGMLKINYCEEAERAFLVARRFDPSDSVLSMMIASYRTALKTGELVCKIVPEESRLFAARGRRQVCQRNDLGD